MEGSDGAKPALEPAKPMARKVRLEYPGAIYHVINRGNYRSWVFESEGAKKAFEECLFEACQKSRWRLHAYVIMGNHFHLAVETPEGNLVSGMHWLQATFACRFNRFRGEKGHLFQGRYKALMVEAGDHLSELCHYIHLNPVRAGVMGVEQLLEYRYSSYWYYRQSRPACMDLMTALAGAGQLSDTKEGWTSYEQYLIWQNEKGPAGKSSAYKSMSQGWVLGSREFKQALVKDEATAVSLRAWDSLGAKEYQRLEWEALLGKAMAVISVADRDQHAGKSAAWKIALAKWMKSCSNVTNGWLAERLDMGTGVYVSKHVGLFNAGKHPEVCLWLKRLNKVNSKT
jgi:REP element-mobilizing transposase RayT